MEIEGKIIAVLPMRSGKSQRTGNEWASQEYVIETHEQYPRKCCFRVFGKDRLESMHIQAGEELHVYFDLDAREYQGRWFNDISAWKVERTADAPTVAPAQMPTAQQSAAATQPVAPAFEKAEDKVDDLPF